MSKKFVLKRIDPLSTAKIMGLLYFGMGLVAAAGFGAMALFGSPSGMAILGFALAAPFLYGGIGFVGTLIMAALYNALATKFGGMAVVLDETSASKPRARRGPPKAGSRRRRAKSQSRKVGER